MKITIITPVFPHPKGGIFPGVERYLQELSLALKKLGVKLEIITSYWNGGKKYDIYKRIPITRIMDSKKLIGPIGSFARLNNITLGLNFLRKKIYKKFYDSNIVILAQPFAFTRFLKLKGVPVVSTAYHYQDPKGGIIERIELAAYHFLQKMQFKIHKRIVAISESTKSDLVSKYKLNQEDIKVIPVGVDSEKFNPRNFDPKIKERFGENIILTVGPILFRKKISVLVKAMPEILKNIPDARLIVLGEGPALGTLKKISKSLMIQNNISFLGFVQEEELLKYYASCNLFVFASELEGFGQVLLESMASGTPVICANKLPMSEIVGNGGVSFKVNSSTDLAKRIIDLLEDKEKRDSLRKIALDLIEQKYRWSVIGKEFIEYLKSM